VHQKKAPAGLEAAAGASAGGVTARGKQRDLNCLSGVGTGLLLSNLAPNRPSAVQKKSFPDRGHLSKKITAQNSRVTRSHAMAYISHSIVEVPR
jgi:hypothetical protein